MASVWEELFKYAERNPDAVLAYAVLGIFVIWFSNQLLYSSICKNITGQAKDWRAQRVIARIVWSEKYFIYFKWNLICLIVGGIGWQLLRYVYSFVPFPVLSLCADGLFALFVISMLVFPLFFMWESKFIRLFTRDQFHGKQHKFLCYMRGVGFKWLILDSRRIRGYTWKNIVFDAKCIYHDGDYNSYYLSGRMPVTYKTKVRVLEKLVKELLKDTDSRVTLASRASPANVKQNFMQHSIPLNPDDYRENVPEIDEGPGSVVQMEKKGLKKELQEDYGKKEPEPEAKRGRVLRGGMRSMDDGRY